MSQEATTATDAAQARSTANEDWLNQVAAKLDVPAEVVTSTLAVLDRIGSKQRWSQLPSSEKDDPYWVACALYVTSKQTDKPVKLMPLLEATNAKFHDFFSHLQLFIPEAKLAKAHEDELTLMRRRVVVITILFHRYERDFNRLFIPRTTSPGSGGDSRDVTEQLEPQDYLFQLGWLLFISAKQTFLGQGADLLFLFHHLICALNVLVVNAPTSLRCNNFTTVIGEGTGQELAAASLGQLCSMTTTVHDEVRGTWTHFTTWLEQNLDKDVDKTTGYILNLCAPTAIAGNVTRLSNLYSQHYEEYGEIDERMYLKGEQVLGRPKRSNDDGMSSAGSSSSSNINTAGNGGGTGNSTSNGGHSLPVHSAPLAPPPAGTTLPSPGNNRIETSVTPGVAMPTQQIYPVPQAAAGYGNNAPYSPYPAPGYPPRTPSRGHLNMAPAQTPMTEAMQGLRWLNQTVNGESDKPTDKLLTYLKQCDPNPTESITQRIEKLAALIEFRGTSTDPATQERNSALRRAQAVKLYYRVLTHMVVSETERLKQPNLGKLLSNDLFHRSLLACCFEVTLFSYQMMEAHFPYVLNALKLEPFDFCKIIENFVTHEPGLPSALKRYLGRIEEIITEQYAWHPQSPLFALLNKRDPAAPIGGNLTGHTAPVASTTNGSGGGGTSSARPVGGVSNRFVSPARPEKRAHPDSARATSGHAQPSASATVCAGASPSGVPQPPKSGSGHALDLFLRKALRISNGRINDWCVRLRLPNHIKSQISEAIRRMVTEHFILMEGRHLDQQLMSCIYGVCRVNRREVTFKEIIDAYRKQRHFNVKTFKEVLIANGEFNDIITYYNSVFIPAMKDVLKVLPAQFPPVAENGTAITGGSGSTSLLGAGATASSSGGGIPSSPLGGRVIVSPMKTPQHIRRQMKDHPNMTPTTRRMWAFGESPARNLHQINDHINDAQGGGGSVQGRALNFDSQPPPEKRQRFMQNRLGSRLNAGPGSNGQAGPSASGSPGKAGKSVT